MTKTTTPQPSYEVRKTLRWTAARDLAAVNLLTLDAETIPAGTPLRIADANDALVTVERDGVPYTVDAQEAATGLRQVTTLRKPARSKEERELAAMAAHTLARARVTLFNGTVFTRLVRHSKAGARYSGVRNGERVATFHASAVCSIEADPAV